MPQLFAALVIAFLLNAAFMRFKDFYRAVYFLPNITSIVAVAIIFGSFFGSQFGFINGLLQAIGLPRIEWINDPFWVKVAISLMVIWRWAGYNAIIYLAGLQSIPHDLYEAATIDGASREAAVLQYYIAASEANHSFYSYSLDNWRYVAAYGTAHFGWQYRRSNERRTDVSIISV